MMNRKFTGKVGLLLLALCVLAHPVEAKRAKRASAETSKRAGCEIVQEDGTVKKLKYADCLILQKKAENATKVEDDPEPSTPMSPLGVLKRGGIFVVRMGRDVAAAVNPMFRNLVGFDGAVLSSIASE